MRFTRFSSFAATAALGAATVLGGAGIAQAQSSGSLGSLMPSSSAPEAEVTPDGETDETPESDVALTITEADENGGKGTLTNNTGKKTSCWVVLGEKGEIETLADEVDGAELAGLRQLLADVDAADNLGLAAFQNDDEIKDGGIVNWEATFDKAFEADIVAGALALCNANDPKFATVYEAEADEEAPGSLDGVLGSLGSSNADETDKVEGTDDEVGSLDGVLGSLGSSDAEETIPA